MKSLGIVASDDDITAWEMTAFRIIENEINSQQELERKRKHGARR